MKKKQSWLGVSPEGRKNHTRPMKQETADRRLRKAVAKVLGAGQRLKTLKKVANVYGTLSYPEPTEAQVERAGY